MHLALQWTVDDRFNKKPWRGLQEVHNHDHLDQDIFVIFQSYILNNVLR